MRENFIERVFAYRRLKRLLSGHWRVGDLIAFHTAEKFLLSAHDPRMHAELGRLVSGAKSAARERVAADYRALFMKTLERAATPRKQANVLQHMADHLKNLLDPVSKAGTSSDD